MDWQVQSVILVIGLFGGLAFGRILIPAFRKIKTGKFDFYIGDRFSKDGSEPKFGGAVLILVLLLQITVGLVYNSSSDVEGLVPLVDVRTVLCSFAAAALFCIIGLYEDYVKEKGAAVGIKPLYKVAAEYLVFLGLVLMYRHFGAVTSDMLLPFHMGFIHFGALYCPLMALFMTAGANMVKIHDCPCGATDYGIDGLCVLTSMIFFLSLSAGLDFGVKAASAKLISVSAMGACGGFLFWNCSPSKLYLGESGSLLLGGLAVICVELSGLSLLFPLMGIVFVVDSVCALLEYIVFKKSKKLLFKGRTLHEHLKKCGWGDFRIFGVSAALSLAGTAAGIVFIVYAGRIM